MHFPSILRVASYKNALIHNGSKGVYKMPDFYILDYLSKKLHFDYVVESARRDILPLLRDSKVDIAIARLPIYNFVLDHADISVPYDIFNVRFLTEKSGDMPKFKAFTYPFSTGVWIFCVFFTLSAAFMSKYITSSKNSVVSILFSLVGSLFKQPLEMEVDSLKKRTWWMTWLIWAALMPSVYCALFLSFLTVPSREPGVKNFQELSAAVQNKRFKCLTLEFQNDDMLTSEAEHIRLLAEEIAKNKWYIQPDNHLPAISKTEAWIGTSKVLELKEYFPPSTIKFISEDSLEIIPVAICVRKGFCCLEKINLALLEAISAGLVNEFYATPVKKIIWKQELRRLEWPEETNHALSIEELQYAFYLLLFGYVLCTIVLLCELFIPKHIVLRVLQQNTSGMSKQRKT